MIKFVFQGDSITDANRNRDDERNYGYGYPNYVAGELLKKYPHKFEFVNEGVSGDRIVDVYARMKCDILNHKPDYMSILIGVNDVWHEYGCQNGVSDDKFEKVYSMLIEEILAEFPNIKIYILEPFTLKGTGNEAYWEEFKIGVANKAARAKNVAEKFGLKFVPLQEKFDKAAADGKNDYWLADGVHPTAAGHALIKDALIEALDF